VDLATLTNAPREVALAGRTYLVSALTLAEWGVLQAFLKDRTKDPVVMALDQLSRAKAAGVAVTEEDRKALFSQATAEARSWPPRVCTGAWFDLLRDTEGASVRFLAVVLRKHQPALTDAEIAAADDGATPDESRLLIYRAMGIEPAPKTPAPATEPAGGIGPTNQTTGQPPSTPSPATA
jgi:hypothetical protein